jgi:hypothetical protein
MNFPIRGFRGLEKNLKPQASRIYDVFLNPTKATLFFGSELYTLEPQSVSLDGQLLQAGTFQTEFVDPFTFNVMGSWAYRLYPDNRPRNLEIAALQKGIVLMANGVELVEEGAGFGVPVAKYSDTPYFCGNAKINILEISENNVILKKTFFLDTVSKKQVHEVNVNDGFYSLVHMVFEKAYLNRQSLRPVFDWMMQVRKTLGIHTHFIKVPPRGTVAVTYHCLPSQIKIHVDLSALDKRQCQEILILNEQGATHFRRYSDAENALLYDRQIGAWTKVSAKQATFVSIKPHVSFSLEKIKGANLYRGREQIKDRFSWAGMTYALTPKTVVFDYTIKIKH